MTQPLCGKVGLARSYVSRSAPQTVCPPRFSAKTLFYGQIECFHVLEPFQFKVELSWFKAEPSQFKVERVQFKRELPWRKAELDECKVEQVGF
jgi:hypothetical protein